LATIEKPHTNNEIHFFHIENKKDIAILYV